MLKYKQSLEGHWVNSMLPRSQRTEQGFLFFGWLLACCIVNRCQLSVHLPYLFFAQLMSQHLPEAESDAVAASQLTGATVQDRGGSGLQGTEVWSQTYIPGPSDLKEFDTEMYAKLSKLQQGNIKSSEFKLYLEAAELPAKTSVESYIRYTIHTLLLSNTVWQMRLIRAGFQSGLGPNGLKACQSMLTVSDLSELICGVTADPNANFDMKEYFRLVLDSEARESPILINTLFEVIDSWAVTRKRKFLHFFTGLDRLPAPASEDLVIEMPFSCFNLKSHKRMLGTLPQAHTCSNTLELPNYYASLQALAEAKQLPVNMQGNGDEKHLTECLRKLLHSKFTMAMDNTAGYALDDAAQEGAANATGTFTTDLKHVIPIVTTPTVNGSNVNMKTPKVSLSPLGPLPSLTKLQSNRPSALSVSSFGVESNLFNINEDKNKSPRPIIDSPLSGLISPLTPPFSSPFNPGFDEESMDLDLSADFLSMGSPSRPSPSKFSHTVIDVEPVEMKFPSQDSDPGVMSVGTLEDHEAWLDDLMKDLAT